MSRRDLLALTGVNVLAMPPAFLGEWEEADNRAYVGGRLWHGWHAMAVWRVPAHARRIGLAL